MKQQTLESECQKSSNGDLILRVDLKNINKKLELNKILTMKGSKC